jgi:hypothetical protein
VSSESETDRPVIDWTHIPHVPQVVVVGRVDEIPVALIELRPRAGFTLSDSLGKELGAFTRIEDAQSYFEERWNARRARYA